ncbi:MAG: hypothetical protein RLZZ605_684 [Bacteroidota bacterium]|jgi:hypothetical protein
MAADVLRLNILLNSTLVLRIGLSAENTPHRIAPIRYTQALHFVSKESLRFKFFIKIPQRTI